MAPFVPNESEWPLVTVTFPAVFTTGEWESYLNYIASYMDRGQPYAMVTDFGRSRTLSPAERKLASDLMVKQRDRLGRMVKGVAVVSDSALLRGMLTAVYWVALPAYPTEVFATVEAGKAWARKMLEGP
jgi:hypothetical protein